MASQNFCGAFLFKSGEILFYDCVSEIAKGRDLEVIPSSSLFCSTWPVDKDGGDCRGLLLSGSMSSTPSHTLQ